MIGRREVARRGGVARRVATGCALGRFTAAGGEAQQGAGGDESQSLSELVSHDRRCLQSAEQRAMTERVSAQPGVISPSETVSVKLKAPGWLHTKFKLGCGCCVSRNDAPLMFHL